MFKYLRKRDEIEEQIKSLESEKEKICQQIKDLHTKIAYMPSDVFLIKRQVYLKYLKRMIINSNPDLLNIIDTVDFEFNADGDMKAYIIIMTKYGTKLVCNDKEIKHNTHTDITFVNYLMNSFAVYADPMNKLLGCILIKHTYFYNFPKALTFMLCNRITKSFPKEIATIIANKILFFASGLRPLRLF